MVLNVFKCKKSHGPMIFQNARCFFLEMTLKITLKRLEMVPGWAMFQRDMSLLLDNALDQKGALNGLDI